ncbi:TIGR04197 family type VII secretion effector [Streptococcus dentapri]|uniref:TIGR04197 family type VII secretion effector n=1 Tax=Streptococcus dentapri TaxID=573564 RepID=A0ABV8D3E4_9STRE
MGTIQSNSGIAQQHATSLSAASNQLADIQVSDKDDRTTVAGNTNAHSVIDLAQESSSAISSAIESVITNLHSVASGFEAADNGAAGKIKNL